jgi:hypothetical protein
MRPDWSATDLNGELVFGRFLGDGQDLDVFQEVLVAAAPRWCSQLRVWKSPRDQIPIEASDLGALTGSVLGAAGERGPTYRQLVKEHGRPPLERFFGSAELRGAGPELVVAVSVDEMVVSPLGPGKDLGNTIALQVRRPTVEGEPGLVWLRETMRALCERLSPVWGSAQHPAEYWAKVMSDQPQIQAVGRDFGRSLPGVFWLNFFGRPYRELVGLDRLRSIPGREVTEVDDGVLAVLSDDPRDWDTPGYAAVEQQVRTHLGEELFFSKSDPERVGLVPEWNP